MTTKKKILVVEDTLSIMEMLKLKLKENNYLNKDGSISDKGIIAFSSS